MGKWIDCTIADIGMVVGGATPSTKKIENYENGTIPWITPKDLSGFEGRYISNGERNITEVGLKSCSTQLMPPHTVLFTSRAPIGYVAIAENEVCTNQGFKSVIPNENTDYMFLYYLLKYNKDKIENMGSGTTFKEVSGNTMKGIAVKVPEDIKEQRAIAGILSSIDDKIELNNNINKNLEAQAYTLYEDIVKRSPEETELSSFITIKHGYAFKGDYISLDNNNVVLVTPGNFKIGGGFQENKCKYFTSEYPSDYILHPGDLIVTMTDLSKQADTLGYGAIVPDTSERVYLHNQRIGLVKFINESLDPIYVYWYLRSYEYHMRIVGTSTGSTVKHTSPGRILEQKIPIPSVEDNDNINSLKGITTMISVNNAENVKLSQVRDLLLPQLLSGKLDVSEVNL